MRNTVVNIEPTVLSSIQGTPASVSKDPLCLLVTQSPEGFVASINIILQSKCFAVVLKVFCSKHLDTPYSVLHTWAVLRAEIIDKYEMQ